MNVTAVSMGVTSVRVVGDECVHLLLCYSRPSIIRTPLFLSHAG